MCYQPHTWRISWNVWRFFFFFASFLSLVFSSVDARGFPLNGICACLLCTKSNWTDFSATAERPLSIIHSFILFYIHFSFFVLFYFAISLSVYYFYFIYFFFLLLQYEQWQSVYLPTKWIKCRYVQVVRVLRCQYIRGDGGGIGCGGKWDIVRTTISACNRNARNKCMWSEEFMKTASALYRHLL